MYSICKGYNGPFSGGGVIYLTNTEKTFSHKRYLQLIINFDLVYGEPFFPARYPTDIPWDAMFILSYFKISIN